MAEETAQQTSATTFGVSATRVQEADGIDLDAIGLEPVEGEAPSETAAPTTEAPTQEAAPAVEEPSAEVDISGPVSREDLNQILTDREREWQRRKDQEVHRERSRLQGELDSLRGQQEQEKLLSMEPVELHDHVHQQADQASQPSVDQITHEVTRRIYSEDVLSPIRALPQFNGLSDTDFQSTIRQAVVSSDRPV
jgi:hypothetical protein